MIRKGTIVRLKRGVGNTKETSRVVVVDRLRKGGVYLDKKIGGFRWWNVAELERVE